MKKRSDYKKKLDYMQIIFHMELDEEENKIHTQWNNPVKIKVKCLIILSWYHIFCFIYSLFFLIEEKKISRSLTVNKFVSIHLTSYKTMHKRNPFYSYSSDYLYCFVSQSFSLFLFVLL